MEYYYWIIIILITLALIVKYERAHCNWKLPSEWVDEILLPNKFVSYNFIFLKALLPSVVSVESNARFLQSSFSLAGNSFIENMKLI